MIENIDRQVNRILSHVTKDAQSGCWLWEGSISPDGYGKTSITLETNVRKTMNAHTALWWLLKAPIPKPLHLDHLCRVRSCVNPDHMEVVTPRENYLRGVGVPAVNARKTHCRMGHPLEGDNLYMQGSARQCRTCKLDRQQKSRAENPDWWKPGYEASKVTITCSNCGKTAERLSKYVRSDGKDCCSRFCYEQVNRKYCKRGHLLEGDNVRWYGPDKKYRACKECNNAHTKEWRAQQKAAIT